jgi:hypothetical protein
MNLVMSQLFITSRSRFTRLKCGRGQVITEHRYMILTKTRVCSKTGSRCNMFGRDSNLRSLDQKVVHKPSWPSRMGCNRLWRKCLYSDFHYKF